MTATATVLSCEFCSAAGGGCSVCTPPAAVLRYDAKAAVLRVDTAVQPWRVVRTDTGTAVLFARSAREAFGRAEVHHALRGLPLRVEALTADGWEAVGEVGEVPEPQLADATT